MIVTYLERIELPLLQLRQPGWEKLEVLAKESVGEVSQREALERASATHIEICFGARGSFGAFSVFDGPARIVSLKYESTE